ncbi:MAG: hypothetical protein OEW58_12035 [Gammaproteobacteria bacterium]|nr:hypothetical protein [Gammaproteobacteria bacterium]
MKLKLLLPFFVCVFPMLAHAAGAGDHPAQKACIVEVDAVNNDAANLEKYWFYRQRLRNEFIFLSDKDEPGSNLPASIRRGSMLQWSDAPIMLAQYISMLATEYALLNGRDEAAAMMSLRELLWALRVIDRLDRRGEAYFRADRSEHEGDFNGFFIRDDIDANFLHRNPIDLATSVLSDLTKPAGDLPGYYATEMSQDQVWHLLMGLALVEKLVPFKGGIDGEVVDMRRWVRKTVFRIVSYMRDHSNWQIQNPVFGKPVLRGAEWDAQHVFSWGFAEAANALLVPHDAGDETYPNMHNLTSRLAQPLFRLALLGKSDNYNQRILSTIARANYAVGLFSFGGPLWKLEHEVLSRNRYRYEQMPLLFVVLHGTDLRIDPTVYGGLLNAAPEYGTFNYGDQYNVCAWSSTSRLVWPEDNETTKPWLLGDYNGLDYMLLHNLYQLVYNQAQLDKLYRH